jgi:outer membrane protein assembly factor BamB
LLVYSEEDISSDGYEEQVVRKYDSRNGVLMGTDRIDIPQKDSSLLFKTSGSDYWADTKSLWAVNQTHQEQWRIEIDDQVQYNPLLIDSKLIFASGIFSDVVCVDNASGYQIWKYQEKIVSDLAAWQGIVYVISTDAAIVGIDASTGKEIGHINVEPRVTETSSRSNAYLITISEGMLFVYYGDSQELIAFSK